MARSPIPAGPRSLGAVPLALAIFLFPCPANNDSALATPPHISSQPQNTSACNGASFYSGRADFYCGATGTQPLSYQWRRGTTNLADGGNMAGANTRTLTI